MRPPVRPQASAVQRTVAAAYLLAAIAAVATSSQLTPNPSGMGTHRQLGLPGCGTLASSGYPCATCGMTTAATHLVHGDLLSALRVHPIGTVLFVVFLMGAVPAAAALFSGVNVWIVLQQYHPTRWALLALALVIGQWLMRLAVGAFSGLYPMYP